VQTYNRERLTIWNYICAGIGILIIYPMIRVYFLVYDSKACRKIGDFCKGIGQAVRYMFTGKFPAENGR
jgi:hypothetical protein